MRKRRVTSDPHGSDSLEEPLLGRDEGNSSSSTRDRDYDNSKKAIVSHDINRVDWEALWSAIASACKAGWSGVLTTISNCLSSIFSSRPQVPLHLTPEQEQRLHLLHQRIGVRYNREDPSHQDTLRLLWGYAYPGEACTSLVDERWTDMGWQQRDPSSDIRGGGLIALENLIYLAQRDSELFQKLRHKTEGERAQSEYPFAVAGVNLTFMLADVLELRRKDGELPAKAAGRAFVGLLEDHSDAFELVYCLVFEVLDRVWLEMRAEYMDFPAVLQRVRGQLESALGSQPRSLEGLRALMTV